MTSTPAALDQPRAHSAVLRFGAVALPLGLLGAFAATAIHPHRENVMDNPAVYTEYAQDSDWIAVHFAQWAAALLLFAGLLGVYYAIGSRTGPGSGLARFGLAATTQAAAAITALQVVDGVALKWAVDTLGRRARRPRQDRGVRRRQRPALDRVRLPELRQHSARTRAGPLRPGHPARHRLPALARSRRGRLRRRLDHPRPDGRPHRAVRLDPAPDRPGPARRVRRRHRTTDVAPQPCTRRPPDRPEPTLTA